MAVVGNVQDQETALRQGLKLHPEHPTLQHNLGNILLARGDLTGALSLLMELRAMSFDYNLAFHTGPIGLCCIEILPWTQPLGGFEHLGHYLCQEEPGSTAKAYREVLGYR